MGLFDIRGGASSADEEQMAFRRRMEDHMRHTNALVDALLEQARTTNHHLRQLTEPEHARPSERRSAAG